MANLFIGNEVRLSGTPGCEDTISVTREEFYRMEREKFRPSLLRRFFNWIKGLFGRRRKTKKELIDEEIERQIKAKYEVKMDDVVAQKILEDGSVIDVKLEDLFIDDKTKGSAENQVLNQRVTYKEFIQDPDVKELIESFDRIKSTYEVTLPVYYQHVVALLNKPEIQRGLNKIQQRYVTCFKVIDTREKGRWERIFSKIYLAYNVDLYSFVNPNPYYPEANPANRYGNFYNQEGLYQRQWHDLPINKG